MPSREAIQISITRTVYAMIGRMLSAGLSWDESVGIINLAMIDATAEAKREGIITDAVETDAATADPSGGTQREEQAGEETTQAGGRSNGRKLYSGRNEISDRFYPR